ncbi:uncharacterized protein LDX57_010103 [Aspergillus melleus]|uniref:uncharacterized protein n=1 Tax=Aspergillus melleus TaxID=138277 RepID=UPI001E8E1AFE|nr:uncharacterized protein LDX57_010103 [Aspergillus melleus]KAH8432468.1 hypothetical protein LDX57_010103 [Aspergillus melleus]
MSRERVPPRSFHANTQYVWNEHVHMTGRSRSRDIVYRYMFVRIQTGNYDTLELLRIMIRAIDQRTAMITHRADWPWYGEIYWICAFYHQRPVMGISMKSMPGFARRCTIPTGHGRQQATATMQAHPGTSSPSAGTKTMDRVTFSPTRACIKHNVQVGGIKRISMTKCFATILDQGAGIRVGMVVTVIRSMNWANL